MEVTEIILAKVSRLCQLSKHSRGFKMGNNFDETHSKQPNIHRKIHTSLYIFKISRKKIRELKSRGFCQMLVISKRKRYPRVSVLKPIENLKPSLWIFILCDFHLSAVFFIFCYHICSIFRTANLSWFWCKKTSFLFALTHSLSVLRSCVSAYLLMFSAVCQYLLFSNSSCCCLLLFYPDIVFSCLCLLIAFRHGNFVVCFCFLNFASACCCASLHAVLRIRYPDPGATFSIPDPNFFHPGFRIRIKEFKYFNPKKGFLSSRKYDSGCSSRIRIPDPDPGSGTWLFTNPGSLIRDPAVKKAPDPGSGSATLPAC